MLYQLSYTPRAHARQVASARPVRKAQWTMGKPTQLPLAPVKIRWFAAR